MLAHAGHIASAVDEPEKGFADRACPATDGKKKTYLLTGVYLRMQDTLTEEMVGLAAGLKRNARAMEAAVTKRGVLLADTDAAVEHNLAATKKSVKRSKEEYKRWRLAALWQTTLWQSCHVLTFRFSA